jgi:hypothetical protein
MTAWLHPGGVLLLFLASFSSLLSLSLYSALGVAWCVATDGGSEGDEP